jgi:hypothetical protein
MGGYHGTKIKGRGVGARGGRLFQKMECPLEWVFYFLQCDPNNGGKIMLVDMASNYITKIKEHFYNDMRTF